MKTTCLTASADARGLAVCGNLALQPSAIRSEPKAVFGQMNYRRRCAPEHTGARGVGALVAACAVAWVSLAAAQQITVVNVIPNAFSDEMNQNAEPSIAVH